MVGLGIEWMVPSDVGRLDNAVFLGFPMHLIVVPRQDEGQKEMQHPARRRLAKTNVHPVVTMHQKALDEDGTSQ